MGHGPMVQALVYKGKGSGVKSTGLSLTTHFWLPVCIVHSSTDKYIIELQYGGRLTHVGILYGYNDKDSYVGKGSFTYMIYDINYSSSGIVW